MAPDPEESQEAEVIPPGQPPDEPPEHEDAPAAAVDVNTVKDELAVELLKQFSAEIDRRAKAGTLAEDLKEMETGKLLSNIRGLMGALRTSTAVQLNVGQFGSAPPVNRSKMLKYSAVIRTPRQRQLDHQSADLQLRRERDPKPPVQQG